MDALKKILYVILVLLGLGGFLSSVFLAIGAKAWFPLVAIGVLGWMAYPTLKRLVNEIMPWE